MRINRSYPEDVVWKVGMGMLAGFSPQWSMKLIVPWTKMAPSQSIGRVLELLVPAQPKDAALTLGKPLSGPDQFDIRTRQLRETAPWITVAPYFAHNLPELLGSHPQAR